MRYKAAVAWGDVGSKVELGPPPMKNPIRCHDPTQQFVYSCMLQYRINKLVVNPDVDDEKGKWLYICMRVSCHQSVIAVIL